MEKQQNLTVDGQAIARDRWNELFKDLALSDDRVFAELYRMTPFGAAAAKGILPTRVQDAASPQGLVVPSGLSDAKLRIYPFRALVGSRTAVGSDALANWRDIRSAIGIGTSALYQEVQFAAGAGGGSHRWDLLWAKVDVDIDDAPGTVYIRAADGTVSSPSQADRKKTVVTLGVTQGTPAGSPVRPNLPADAGSSYYIPLAYVLIIDSHTLSTAIPASRIHEVAPVLGQPLQSTLRPANHCYKDGGTFMVARPWTTSQRTLEYLPPTFQGKEERIVGVRFGGTGATVLAGASAVIDDSIDWRKRMFKTTLTVDSSNYIWSAGPNWGFGNDVIGAKLSVQAGQSFSSNGLGATNHGVVADISSTFLSAITTGRGYIGVDLDTGALVVYGHTTLPNLPYAVFWVEASAQYVNY